jgi:hypothetical protein
MAAQSPIDASAMFEPYRGLRCGSPHGDAQCQVWLGITADQRRVATLHRPGPGCGRSPVRAAVA